MQKKQDDNATYSQCTRYDVNWTDPAVLDMDIMTPNSSWPVVPCDHGWEYDMSEVLSSIVIDVRFFLYLCSVNINHDNYDVMSICINF